MTRITIKSLQDEIEVLETKLSGTVEDFKKKNNENIQLSIKNKKLIGELASANDELTYHREAVTTARIILDTELTLSFPMQDLLRTEPERTPKKYLKNRKFKLFHKLLQVLNPYNQPMSFIDRYLR